MKNILIDIFDKLYSAYGPQHWWPGDSTWEICIGAILTQNTNWNNVEKAIVNLKRKDFISASSDNNSFAQKILNEKKELIEDLIRPSGYFRQKTLKLKEFSLWWMRNTVNGKIPDGFKMNDLRDSLLSVKGIGPETADSILLYAFDCPSFVIDSYTKRIMSRHIDTDVNIEYHSLRKIFMDNLPEDAKLFNEFHALLVKLAKDACLKKECSNKCVLRSLDNYQ